MSVSYVPDAKQLKQFQDQSLQQYLFKDFPKSQEASNIADYNQEHQIAMGSSLSNNSAEIQLSLIEGQAKMRNNVKLERNVRNRFSGHFTQSELKIESNSNSSGSNQNLPKIWRHKFFSILGVFAKFFRFVRLRLIHFHPEYYLSPLHFQIINDASYYQNPNEEGSQFFSDILNRDKLALMKAEKSFGAFQKSLRKSYRKFIRWSDRQITSCSNPFFSFLRKYLPIPQGALKLWDLLVMLVLLAEIIIVSLHISFEGSIQGDMFSMIQIPFLLVLILDVFLSFFKGYQEKGVFQIEIRGCFRHYFLEGFFLDVACLLFYAIAESAESKVLYCFFILRLAVKYYDYQQNVIEAYQLSERFGTEKIKLIELTFTLLFLAHIFGCVWYWIGDQSLQSASQLSSSNSKYYVSWLEAYNLNTASWQEKYVASLFFIFTIMTTIGFGDIVPQNLQERLIAICLMLLSCFVFAYCVNAIGGLLTSMNEKQSFHRVRLKSINSFMSDKKISDSLQSKIRSYLDYIYHEEINGTSKRDSTAVEFLSKGLYEQLLVEVNFNVLLKMKIFRSETLPFSNDLLRQLSLCVKEKTYMPDEIINQENEDDAEIFHIAKGEVKYCLNLNSRQANPTVIQVLKEGNNFGGFHFFSQQLTSFYAKPTCVTTVYFLKYSDFLRIIQQHQDDFVILQLKKFLPVFNKILMQEKFCMLREQLLLSQNFDQLYMTCSLCSWGNHQEINCPLVNYNPQKSYVLAKGELSRPLYHRSQFNRSERIKINSVVISQIINDQARDFQEDKGIMSSDLQKKTTLQFIPSQSRKSAAMMMQLPKQLQQNGPNIAPQDRKADSLLSSIELEEDFVYPNSFQEVVVQQGRKTSQRRGKVSSVRQVDGQKVQIGFNQNQDELESIYHLITPEKGSQYIQELEEYDLPEPSQKQQEQEALLWREENGDALLCPWTTKVKGDLVEIDTQQEFRTYRTKDNFSLKIEQFNKKQFFNEPKKSQLGDLRKTRRQNHKGTINIRINERQKTFLNQAKVFN